MSWKSISFAAAIFLLGAGTGTFLTQKILKQESLSVTSNHRDFLLQFTPLYDLTSLNPTQENLNRLQQVMDSDLFKIYSTNLTTERFPKKIEPIQISFIQGTNPYQVHFKKSQNQIYTLSVQLTESSSGLVASQVSLAKGQPQEPHLKVYQQQTVSLKAPCPLTLSALQTEALESEINPFMTDLLVVKSPTSTSQSPQVLRFHCLDRDFKINLEKTDLPEEHVLYQVIPLEKGISSRQFSPSKVESALQNELGLEVQETR